MITLVCYWWALGWNVELDKTMFAVYSTVELAFELVGVFIWFLVWYGNGDELDDAR